MSILKPENANLNETSTEAAAWRSLLAGWTDFKVRAGRGHPFGLGLWLGIFEQKQSAYPSKNRNPISILKLEIANPIETSTEAAS